MTSSVPRAQSHGEASNVPVIQIPQVKNKNTFQECVSLLPACITHYFSTTLIIKAILHGKAQKNIKKIKLTLVLKRTIRVYKTVIFTSL